MNQRNVSTYDSTRYSSLHQGNKVMYEGFSLRTQCTHRHTHTNSTIIIKGGQFLNRGNLHIWYTWLWQEMQLNYSCSNIYDKTNLSIATHDRLKQSVGCFHYIYIMYTLVTTLSLLVGTLQSSARKPLKG